MELTADSVEYGDSTARAAAGNQPGELPSELPSERPSEERSMS